MLDIGCGQGRNALAIGELSFEVTGIDNSKTGIDQMNELAKEKNLNVTGIIGDMFAMNGLNKFDYLILDSMFHFTKNDKEKEVNFLKDLLLKAKDGTEVIISNLNTDKKCDIIKETFLAKGKSELILEKDFEYIFIDSETKHTSTSPYKFLVFKK